MLHDDPLTPHAHDPNPDPPSADPTFLFVDTAGGETEITVDALRELPRASVPNCYIVSTGHGVTGPMTFSGVTLLDFVEHHLPPGTDWAQVEVVSGDGFGNRVLADELRHPHPAERPILLAYAIDGTPMTRRQGLVRMIVPGETDDALRQVKWIGRIIVRK